MTTLEIAAEARSLIIRTRAKGVSEMELIELATALFLFLVGSSSSTNLRNIDVSLESIQVEVDRRCKNQN